MKLIWKLVIIAVVAGLALSAMGMALGASRALYWSKNGIVTDIEDRTVISHPDLGYVKSIEINAKFADVRIVESDAFGLEIFGREEEWKWELSGDALRIENMPRGRIQVFDFNWIDHRSDYVKVFIPAGAEFEKVVLKSDSGDAVLGGFTANETQINVKFGDVSLKSAKSDRLSVDMGSGDFSCEELAAKTLSYKNKFGEGKFKAVSADKFTAENESGDLELTGCAFSDTDISVKFGGVKAKDIKSSKTYISSESGDVSLEGDFTGETVIRNKFGDINLTAARAREFYSYDISARFGVVRFGDDRMGDNASINSGAVTENHLKINSESGDITVKFK